MFTVYEHEFTLQRFIQPNTPFMVKTMKKSGLNVMIFPEMECMTCIKTKHNTKAIWQNPMVVRGDKTCYTFSMCNKENVQQIWINEITGSMFVRVKFPTGSCLFRLKIQCVSSWRKINWRKILGISSWDV